MSAPERIWVTPDDTMGWGVAWACDRVENVIKPSIEYVRADTVAETIRQAVQAEREACAIAAGDAAVDALMRQDPDAGPLRRQLVRTKAISAIRARGDA